MKKVRVLVGLIGALVVLLTFAGYASATPSPGFHEIDGEVFDDWQVCRTRAYDEDGYYQITEASFRPAIAFESLGENADLACSLGEQLAQKYPDRHQRAEAIFHFVRDRVNYTSDRDQFGYDEFAQNADELAAEINGKGVGYGDCEDSAVLLAVMYKGAGFRSAIAVGSGHTATLVYLPDYGKAAAVFELEGEPGWIWAEATGRNNPLGWVPKEFIGAGLAAYEVTAEAIEQQGPAVPSAAIARTGGATPSPPFPFIGVIGFLWLLSLFRRRRAH